MFSNWIRSCFVDPELERKLHETVDRANNTSKKAERLVDDAGRKLRRLDGAEVAVVAVGSFLLAGVIIGTLRERLNNGNDSKK